MRELAPCSWASMIEMALWSFMIKVVRDGPKLLDGSGQGDPRPNKVVGGSIPDHGIISLATWRKTSQVVKCLPPAFQKNKRSLMVKKEKSKPHIANTMRSSKNHFGAVQVPVRRGFRWWHDGIITLPAPTPARTGKLHKMAYKLWPIRGNLRVWGEMGLLSSW